MKLRTGILAAGLVTTGMVLTVVAQAQPGPARGGFVLPGVDSDGDGLITRSEVNAAVDSRFGQLDTDGDGAISRDELRAGADMHRADRRDRMQARSDERFAAIDTDGDGALSLAELQAMRPELTQERFEQMDRNNDGLITPDERPIRGPGVGPGPFRPGAR